MSDDLTSLSSIASGAANPGIDSSVLSIDRGIVSATSRHSPGGHSIDGAANTEGATRVTIAGSLASIVDTDHELAVEAASPSGAALTIRDDGNAGNSLQSSGKSARS